MLGFWLASLISSGAGRKRFGWSLKKEEEMTAKNVCICRKRDVASLKNKGPRSKGKKIKKGDRK